MGKLLISCVTYLEMNEHSFYDTVTKVLTVSAKRLKNNTYNCSVWGLTYHQITTQLFHSKTTNEMWKIPLAAAITTSTY